MPRIEEISGKLETIEIQMSTGAMVDRGDGVYWEWYYSNPSAKSIALSFSGISFGSNLTFQISLTDEHGKALATYSDSDFIKTNEFTTPLFRTNYIKVQVLKLSEKEALHFTVHKALVSGGDSPIVDGLMDVRDYLDSISDLDESIIPQALPAVGKLIDYYGFTCTGFLVGDEMFLTTYFCVLGSASGVPIDKLCRSASVEFTYSDIHQDADSDLRQERYWLPYATRKESYSCHEVIKANMELDYALLRLESHALGKKPSFRSVLQLASHADFTSRDVTVLQYRSDANLMIAYDCRASVTPRDETTNSVHHNCSTSPGSAGAPILDRSNTVIGIHSYSQMRDKPDQRQRMSNVGLDAARIYHDIREVLPYAGRGDFR